MNRRDSAHDLINRTDDRRRVGGNEKCGAEEARSWRLPDDRPAEDLVPYQELAAQCWCLPSTQHIEMDVNLGTAFARLLRYEVERCKSRIRELEAGIDEQHEPRHD